MLLTTTTCFDSTKKTAVEEGMMPVGGNLSRRVAAVGRFTENSEKVTNSPNQGNCILHFDVVCKMFVEMFICTWISVMCHFSSSIKIQ